ncbi:uncharacterized protein BDZ99DRAFT_516707 [Mytilinidion resinicola]|uniref:Knr4/Smi1-like domain-containing protein n=1 Tax=Mytilinidion resinicola TaxID=574789 RepID=A0A6A6Z1H9_9PEZI|nr:uncharacterized protein BDZ99DRAFT_516707 [Mytilinidion resinicola]KAF2814087.1 hypothetical protein BDZ99DRAFT_516707 [Mytilinidion resinicola]
MASVRSLPLIPWSHIKILSERDSTNIASHVLPTIADLMILGYIGEANQLVSFLYENSLKFEVREWMYLAWASSNNFPEVLGESHSEDRKNWFEDDEIKERRLNGFGKQTGWPQRLRSAYPNFVKADLEYATEAVEDGMLRNDGAAVEVALRLGEKEAAEKVVKEQVVKKFRMLDEKKESKNRSEMEKLRRSRHQILESRRIWGILDTKVVGKKLGVDESAVAEYVTQGVELIKERLNKGPARPYADMTIPDLLKLMDESYIAARKANPEAGSHMNIIGHSLPKTFLKDPATDEEITALETKLGENEENWSKDEPFKLPEDYKSFLRASNGFYVDVPDDTCGEFYGTSAVEWDDGFIADLEPELLPNDHNTNSEDMDPIQIPEPRAFSVSAGGDEGNIWMVHPECLKAALELFEEAYENASEDHQRLYERVANDLYGGLEEMRNMKWLVMKAYHWNPEPQPYREFRGYLEEAVRYAVDQRADDEVEKEESDKRGTKRKHDDQNEGYDETGEEEDEGDAAKDEDSSEDDEKEGEGEYSVD